MKRCGILLMAIWLGMPFVAISQKMYLGPDLGVNIIHLGKSETGNDFQLGVQAGVHFSYRFSDQFSLRTGLYVAQKKQTYQMDTSTSLLDEFGGLLDLTGLPIGGLGLDSLNIPGVNLDVNERVDGVASPYYVELPVMVSFHVSDFNFTIGPTVGILLGTNNKERITTTIPLFQVVDVEAIDSSGLLSLFLPPAERVTADRNSSIENFARMDVGAVAGIGYAFDNFHLNLLYSQSFLDYRDDRGDSDRKTHRAFRLSLAYNFAIKSTGK